MYRVDAAVCSEPGLYRCNRRIASLWPVTAE